MSGNSLESVNESLIRSRTLVICESYAEKSRSEQMKCLQIWRTGSYTWNLSAGWLHLDIYHAIKVVGWGKRKKTTHRWNFVMKASKSWKYKAKLGATVCVSERTQHRDRLDNSVSASHLVVPGSIMRQRISRWKGSLKVSGLTLCHLGSGCSGSYLGKFWMPLGMKIQEEERKSNTRMTKIEKIEVIKRKQNQLRANEFVLAA